MCACICLCFFFIPYEFQSSSIFHCYQVEEQTDKRHIFVSCTECQKPGNSQYDQAKEKIKFKCKEKNGKKKNYGKCEREKEIERWWWSKVGLAVARGI